MAIKFISRLPGLINTHKTDITWINRELIPAKNYFINLTSGIRVFDIDDALWVGSEKLQSNIGRIVKEVDVVFAGNRYIANWCAQYCNKVYVIPTAVDVRRFCPPTIEKSNHDFVVGWTGTKYTLHYLYAIEGALSTFLGERKDASLLVISDERPKDEFLRGCNIQWVEWTAENEASILVEMDVGIMPLPNDEWAKGKCSFKMIQYMATGKATIVSPVGMNVEILSYAPLGLAATSDKEWVEALTKLYENSELRIAMGKAGRRIAEDYFSVDVVAKEISEIFKKITT